jgi:hypothetical protein
MKFLTPAQMAICLLLFFLPWVELQCPMPKGGMNMQLNEPKLDSKDVVWTGFIHQSGLQVATGKFSFSDSTMQQMADAKGGPKGGKDKDGKDGPDAAPLMWVYLLAVLGAVALGFVLPSGAARKAALAACCGLALVVAGGQAAMGFPIAKAMNDDPKLGGAKGGGKANPMTDEMFGDLKPKVKYKFPFYLSLLLCVGGLVTALIEPGPPVKPRKRRVEEADDEYLPPDNDR